MRSSLANLALVVLTTVGLSGCKSGGVGVPKWSNPFAKSSARSTRPERPTANATPAPPSGSYAAGTADTVAPPFDRPSVAASSYDVPAARESQPSSYPSTTSGSAAGYDSPGRTASTGNPYMAPQTGRYDTGGGYGSPAAGPSYNDPPPYMASRSSSQARDGSSTRDYSAAAPYGRYGSSPETAPRDGVSRDVPPPSSIGPRDPYGDSRYRSAAGPRDSSLSSGPAGSYDRLSPSRPDTDSASRYGGSATRYGTDADSGVPADSLQGRDSRNVGSGSSHSDASGAASRYDRLNITRPWNRTGQDRSDASGAIRDRQTPDATGYGSGDTGYRPGDTDYRPGDTGYRPGDTGYDPPGAPKYQSPAAPYNLPAPPYASPAAGSDTQGYRPGSTSTYTPRKSTDSGGSGTSSQEAPSRYPTPDFNVAPTGFSQPTAKGAL